MSENNDIKKDTIPENESQILIPIKFNKEIINLSIEKAQELSQKGMKFDIIAKDFEELKELACVEGKNVSEYIACLKSALNKRRLTEITEKCGGDGEFAKYILELEQGKADDIKGFDELKENFPKIKSIEDLPKHVIEAANLKGTLLLDEYLRYLHKEECYIKENIKKQNKSSESSMGPFVNNKGGSNPETAEFLRGLWQK